MAPAGDAFATGLPDFTTVVARVTPVVVNISTTQRLDTLAQNDAASPGGGDRDDPSEDWYRHFFGALPSPRHGDDGGGALTAESLGSGFIISADGEILTNYHVIKDAERITVKLNDRRVLPAKILGVDPSSDLALLKINAVGLPVAAIGDASRLRVGQWVLAIGSPFGFDHSVTAGIVSAKGRSIGCEQYVPYIQTDVPINPGNSGGPLFNLEGQVVGINSEIYSRTGGYQGVSFAIPINLAMQVVRQLRQHGHVTRGWLGVNILDLSPDMAASLHLSRPEGALVREVVPASPAARAGIQAGDVILTYGGANVVSSQALPPLVGSTSAGRDVPLTILRDGKREMLRVRIGVLPTNAMNQSGEAGEQYGLFDSLGLAVRSLSSGERRRFHVAAGGVMVEQVIQGAGRRAGFEPGDVVLMVNSTRVTGLRQFQFLARQLPVTRAVPVLVKRSRQTLFLPLRAGG